MARRTIDETSAGCPVGMAIGAVGTATAGVKIAAR
jgi:hypothetical protein